MHLPLLQASLHNVKLQDLFISLGCDRERYFMLRPWVQFHMFFEVWEYFLLLFSTLLDLYHRLFFLPMLLQIFWEIFFSWVYIYNDKVSVFCEGTNKNIVFGLRKNITITSEEQSNEWTIIPKLNCSRRMRRTVAISWTSYIYEQKLSSFLKFTITHISLIRYLLVSHSSQVPSTLT